jgi:hypothetical protein
MPWWLHCCDCKPDAGIENCKSRVVIVFCPDQTRGTEPGAAEVLSHVVINQAHT